MVFGGLETERSRIRVAARISTAPVGAGVDVTLLDKGTFSGSENNWRASATMPSACRWMAIPSEQLSQDSRRERYLPYRVVSTGAPLPASVLNGRANRWMLSGGLVHRKRKKKKKKLLLQPLRSAVRGTTTGLAGLAWQCSPSPNTNNLFPETDGADWVGHHGPSPT